MPMRLGTRGELRPIVVAAALRICQNPLHDGSPCRDCIYTIGFLGRDLSDVIVGNAKPEARDYWRRAIMLAATDG